MKTFDVQDIIDAEYNLEPLKCRFCNSLNVAFNQYIGDAYCEECGRWQLEKTEKENRFVEVLREGGPFI